MNVGALAPGTHLGSYEVLAVLGQGGVATVYRARHQFLDRQVALKVLHPFLTDTPEFITRFREEGRLLARLEHPHIVRVYDAGEASGLFYLATNYLEGWTLAEAARRAVPLEAALSITAQVLRALDYAHAQGVVHRDVKPANVILSPQGHVTLTDLGVARLIDSPGVTLPGLRIGTPYYMAPEQILGAPVDGRADLYATGVLLYQMVAGQVPFPGPATETVYSGHLNEEPDALPEGAPAWLQPVLQRALAKSPQDRFPTAQAFLQALARRHPEPPESAAAPAVESLPAPSRPESGPPTVVSASRRAPDTALRKEDRAVLSLDVVGSTRMKLPGLTTAIQHQFGKFRRYVAEHLEKHRCLTHQWAGDGLLALFARPSDAAACAQALLADLAEFNAALPSTRQPIRIRTGVHAGPVHMADGQPLGELTSRTLDYAGHLQKHSPPDGLLISEAVYQALSDPAEWELASEALPDFPFAVYRIGGSTAGDEPAPAPPPIVPEPAAAGTRIRLRIARGSQEQICDIDLPALIGRPDPAGSRAPEIELHGDSAISRRHARIVAREGRFFLEDLDSSNGTELNTHTLRPYVPEPLGPGDEIRLGEGTVLRVEAIDPPV